MNLLRATKATIWLYFWLLLLEGVLRKWVFPEWSDLIFVIRDPLVLFTYLLAWRNGTFPARPAMVVVWLLGVLSLAFSFAGDTSFVVTLFGLRTNYLHLPLVFIMGQVLDRNDVLRFGRAIMLCSIGVLALMIVQFNSAPDAWINAGVGGTEGGQLRGAMGRIRAPGPFSFVGGVVNFFPLVLAFVIYGWVHRGAYPRILVVIGSIVLVAVVPVSISRSLLLALLVVVLFAVPVVLRDIRRIPSFLGPLTAIFSLAVLAADTIYVEAFLVRWEESITAGGGDFYSNVIERMVGEFTQPFQIAADAPLFGHGIGLGTVAGARLTTGAYTFLLAESELARIVLELGPLLGFAFILWRVWLGGLEVTRSWTHFLSEGDALGWLLAGASFLVVVNGQWGPSTQLGFAVFGAGLTLGALNAPQEEAEDETDDSEETDPEAVES